MYNEVSASIDNDLTNKLYFRSNANNEACFSTVDNDLPFHRRPLTQEKKSALTMLTLQKTVAMSSLLKAGVLRSGDGFKEPVGVNHEIFGQNVRVVVAVCFKILVNMLGYRSVRRLTCPETRRRIVTI